MMPCVLELNEAERKLILELLERERRDLHPEIRHTDNREYRHELQARSVAVGELIQRSEAQAVTAG